MAVDKETRVTFPSGDLLLEGLLARGAGGRGVVISHPHPLYGGEMRNHVVSIVQEVFAGKGWTTLRFNFRGVGRSQGKYAEGVGEQEDVRAAVRYLQGLGIQELYLAGYSFGSWVNAQAAMDLPEVAGTILVAPPQAMLDFSFLKDDAKTKLVIAGEWDSFGPVEEVKKVLGEMNSPPALIIIPEADHFFDGAAKELAQALESLAG
ncbi:MAG: alpha/beta fold hydrolase [Deltaproteobacteria bacterium]|nr:alpha/beta fold hydrolase [Deltaproteobacteria bacterium]